MKLAPLVAIFATCLCALAFPLVKDKVPAEPVGLQAQQPKQQEPKQQPEAQKHKHPAGLDQFGNHPKGTISNHAALANGLAKTFAVTDPGIVLKNGGTTLYAKLIDSNPPDVAGAAGPRGWLGTANWILGYVPFSPSTVPGQTIQSRNLYGTAGDAFDQRVAYNPVLGKFLVGGIGPGGFVSAMSANSQPASFAPGDWTVKPLGIGTDYPQLVSAADGGWLLNFNGPYAKLLRVHPDYTFDLSPLLLDEIQYGSVPSLASTNDKSVVWMIRVKDSERDKLRIFRVDNPFAAAPVTTAYDLPIAQLYGAGPVYQPDGSTLPTGQMLGNAMVQQTADGVKHLVFVVNLGNVSNVATAFWYDIDVTGVGGAAPKMIQQGQVPGFNPSIGMNAAGDIALCVCQASKTVYLSICITGRRASDPLGVMRPLITVKTSPSNARVSGRFGDYSTIAVDPTDGSFWAAQQYADESLASPNFNWAVWVQQFAVSPPAPATFPISGTISTDKGVLDFQGVGTWRK